MHLLRFAAGRLASVVICLSATLPTSAMSADQAPLPAGACELHVWPAGGIGMRTAGLGVGFGLIGALADAKGHEKGDRVRQSAANDAFGPDKQLAALMADDPTTALHLASYRVVQHNQPLELKDVRTKLRHSDSTAPCYAELITTDMFYYKGAIYKGTFTVNFAYLKFGTKSKATSRYSNGFPRALNLSDPRDASVIAEAGNRFAEIYSESFKQFAHYAVAQPDWK